MRLKEFNFQPVVLAIILAISCRYLVNCSPVNPSSISQATLFGNSGTIRNTRNSSIFLNENETPIKSKFPSCPIIPSEHFWEQPYYYHKATNKCYQGFTRGPCGPDMVFGLDSFNSEGVCFCKPSGGPHGQMLVYDPLTNQCFPVYTQGQCSEEYWIVFDKAREKFHCDYNPCKSVSSQYHQVLFENRCVSIGAECENEEGQSGSVRFQETLDEETAEENSDPKCILNSYYSYGSAGAVATSRQCKRGTYRSFNGKCVPTFSWLS